MKIHRIFALLVAAACLSAPPVQAVTWRRTIYDYASSVQQTADSGYIITGYENVWDSEFRVYDAQLLLTKLNKDGYWIWQKSIGGSNGDYGNHVQQTNDGGYIVAGHTASNSQGYADAWLVKTDAEGNETWSKTFGGAGWDYADFVLQDDDGGYVVAGRTASFGAGGSDAWLIKTDENGNEIWNKTYGGRDSDYAAVVRKTGDGGYIFAGSTRSFGAGRWDIWVVRTDAGGNEIWNETYGGEEWDIATCLQATTDGGYVVAGQTESAGAGDFDIILVKIDADGFQDWSRTFGGRDSDEAYAVHEVSDGGFIIGGNTESLQLDSAEPWLIRTDADGQELWHLILEQYWNERLLEMQPALEGGYIMLTEDIDGSYSHLMYQPSFDQLLEFVDRFYELFAGQKSEQDELNAWVNGLLDGSLTGGDLAEAVLSSQGFVTRDPSDDQFLEILYQAFFNREPDEGGQAYWKAQLEAGIDRAQVLNGFIYSVEFLTYCSKIGVIPFTEAKRLAYFATPYINGYFEQFTGQKADPAVLNDWLTALLDDRSKSLFDLIEELYNSQQFKDLNTTDEEFVTILYKALLERDPEQAGFDHWLAKLTSEEKTREDVIWDFVRSWEFNWVSWYKYRIYRW